MNTEKYTTGMKLPAKPTQNPLASTTARADPCRGARPRAHRHASSAVYCAAEGRGHSVIEGIRFDWEPGDAFAVPSWAWHEHAAAEGEEAVLFSIHDGPVMEALGLYREEAYEMRDGRQEVTGAFA